MSISAAKSSYEALEANDGRLVALFVQYYFKIWGYDRCTFFSCDVSSILPRELLLALGWLMAQPGVDLFARYLRLIAADLAEDAFSLEGDTISLVKDDTDANMQADQFRRSSESTLSSQKCLQDISSHILSLQTRIVHKLREIGQLQTARGKLRARLLPFSSYQLLLLKDPEAMRRQKALLEQRLTEYEALLDLNTHESMWWAWLESVDDLHKRDLRGKVMDMEEENVTEKQSAVRWGDIDPRIASRLNLLKLAAIYQQSEQNKSHQWQQASSKNDEGSVDQSIALDADALRSRLRKILQLVESKSLPSDKSNEHRYLGRSALERLLATQRRNEWTLGRIFQSRKDVLESYRMYGS